MTATNMTVFRVTSDGKNLPVAWRAKETIATKSTGEWIIFPQEAGSAVLNFDASAGSGYVQFTDDVEAVLAGTTPAGIVNWSDGEIADAVKRSLCFAGGAVRQVNLRGTTVLTVIAKVGGFGLDTQIDDSMAAVAATGSIAIAAGNVADGDTITIGDGTHTAVTLEGDSGAKASGTVTLAAGNASSGDTVDLHSKTFEINDGAAATGSIALATVGGTPTNPTKGDTITLNDGTNPATVLELDSGAFAAGGIQLTDQPADGNTITINDGVHAASVLELDVGAKATGIITHASNPNDGDTVIVTDGTLTKTFEADEGAKATGTIELTSNDLQAATIEIGDGATSETLELDAGTFSTAQITFIDQPDANCTLEISDGTHTQTFEFAGVGGNINVAIGATALDTMDNLIAAIITSTLTVDAAPGGSGLTRDLLSQLIGAANSITITEAGDTSSHVSTSVVAGIDAGDNVTAGNVGVAIGATASDTCDNIVTAINGTGLTMTAAPGGGDTVTLTHDDFSAAGNVAMIKAGTKSANITLTGMANGANPGDAVTPGNIGYAIGATKEATAANFLAVFTTSGLNITAAESAPADDITNLTHNLYSTTGNQTIDVTGAGGRITTTNLTGGLNPGQDITPGNVGVAIGATKEATMVNIIAAINAIVADLTITATPSTPADAECTLLSDVVGTDPNGGLSKNGANITITQLAGGLAAGTDITPGNTGVAIGVDADATMVNLIAAINGIVGTLTITASPAAPADHTCTLAADTKDATHNVTITTTGAAIQVVGMSGGFDNGDNVSNPTYVGVALGVDNETTIDNLITKLEANLALDNTATVKDTPGAGAYRVTIVWGVVGLAGNATVTVVGANLTKTNMAGGLEPGSSVTPGNIGFAIGSTNLLTAANITAAIVAANAANTLDITPTNGGAGTITLRNDVPGVAGTVTITKSGANITVTGMTGGVDAVTMRELFDNLSEIVDRMPGGTALTNAAGASGANLLVAHATLKHKVWKLFIRAGASTSITLSDGVGVFGTDASGNCVVDLNPIGSVQTTAATAITLTTGDAGAWTATVIHSAE